MPISLLTTETPLPPIEPFTPSEVQVISTLMFLSILLIIYSILTLIANAVLLSSCGEKWWKGIIPVYGKYCVFKQFWNVGFFVAYLSLMVIYVFSGMRQTGGVMEAVNSIIGFAIIALETYLSERIAYSMNKGLITIVLLTLFYPFAVFVLCLIMKEKPDTEEIRKKYREKEEKIKERYRQKELRKSDREKRKRERREKKWNND